MSSPLTVVYDDKCPVCTVGKNFSEQRDTEKQIEFVGMNTPRGATLIAEHKLDMNASAYALRDGVVLEKEHMVREVLSHNGIIGTLLSLPFKIPLVGRLLYTTLSYLRSFVTKSTN